MSEAAITNALLRCTREDDLARDVFDLVRNDLDLWVLELPDTIRGIADVLGSHHSLLKSLGDGATDYTLHLAATVDETCALAIPAEVAALSAECGFTIEVISSPS